MKCSICDASNWHERKDINPNRPLQICKSCGNVQFLVDPGDEQKVKDYYRKEYRPAPNVGNLITSAHKQHYVRIFLADYLKGKKGLVCTDIGSAIGYIPNFLRRLGHHATGVELTLTYRRFCEHFYGIPLTEEIDGRRKYDLITIYHVLEHLIEPDKKLAEYVALLKEDGRIMISTPEWFNVLEEASGSPISTLDHLYHHDHINVFSAQSIKNLFAKAGLVIEKEDHVQYGQTYLLRKAKEGEAAGRINESWEKVSESLDLQKRAVELYIEKRYREAADVWPKFPDAYLKMIYELHLKTPDKQEEIFVEALKAMPENSRMRLTYGIHAYQQERFEDAIREFLWVMERKPFEDVMMYLGWCYSHLGNPKEANKWFYRAADMNPQKWTEAMNWITNQCSKLPTWDESAMNAIKDQIAANAQTKIVPQDPIMDAVTTPESPKLEVK